MVTADNQSLTLAELFPGNLGRMKMIRVMLRLKMPKLMEMDHTKSLPAELLSKITQTIAEINGG